MDIETDGSIHPENALKGAANILIQHFMLFSDQSMILDTATKGEPEQVDEELLHMRKLLKTSLNDLDLSVRAYNCLKAAEVRSLGDLVNLEISEMMKFRNFGKKSLAELEQLVVEKGLTFGMDLAPFLLEGWATPATKTPATALGMGSGWVQGVSLAEIVQEFVPGGKDGNFGSNFSLGRAVKANMRQYGPAAIGTAIVTPIAFKIGRRLLSRSGVTRYANKAFKMTGLPVRV